jgi:hypothetical protein
LFWRKKKNKQDDPFCLVFEEGPRYYFRVSPDPGRPVTFRVGERVFTVEDISAGGVALRAGDMTAGQRLAGTIHLPGGERPLPVVTVVRGVSPHGVAGTQFSEIREADREVIHLYVLGRQKEDIERRRGQGKEDAGGESGV